MHINAYKIQSRTPMEGFYLMAFTQPLVFSPGRESMQVQELVALRWMLHK